MNKKLEYLNKVNTPKKLTLGKIDNLLDNIRQDLFDGTQKAIGHGLDAIQDLDACKNQSEENRSIYVNYVAELQEILATFDELGLSESDVPDLQEVVEALNEFGDVEARFDNLDNVINDLVELLRDN
tara:strand:+ start:10695 stop:11075 length:381 start_codon:yes stop_codon:yes gene_type:complete